MDIFVVRDGKVSVTPEVLLIYPFNQIWEEDTEELAIRKFTFIEFMCSRKKSNPFIEYKMDERPSKILISFSSNENDEIINAIPTDELVISAMDVYNKLQNEASISLRFYESAIAAAEKMNEFFINFDLNKVNFKTGTLLYKPADITRALKDVNEVLKTLGGLKVKVQQELYEDVKGKAGREINHFEKSKNERQCTFSYI